MTACRHLLVFVAFAALVTLATIREYQWSNRQSLCLNDETSSVKSKRDKSGPSLRTSGTSRANPNRTVSATAAASTRDYKLSYSNKEDYSSQAELMGYSFVYNEQELDRRDDVDDDNLLVQQGDSVYLRGDWDGAPIVIEKYKLVFFTQAKVGCTIWKQLFRRIMGLKDWKEEATKDLLPWNPELNGLKYLYDYNRSTASHMMTDPLWTRAIFVREPKERFLSAYLDKGVGNSYFMQNKCCPYKGDCVEKAKESLSSFFELVITCEDGHWSPQHRRMEDRYWNQINFVGHMKSAVADAERLLRQIGAWEPYGHGWGPHGNLTIFHTNTMGRMHATHAHDRLRQYYTPQLEHDVDVYNRGDYQHTVLNLTKIHIF